MRTSFIIVLAVTVICLQCEVDARTFARRSKALAVAEGEKDIQPVTGTTENQQSSGNADVSSVSSGEEERAIKSAPEGGRLARSRLSPRPLCGSGMMPQSEPEKRVEDESKLHLARLEEEKPNLTKVEEDADSEQSEEKEVTKKVRKIQKVRRIQKSNIDAKDEDEVKASKVETDPVTPIEIDSDKTQKVTEEDLQKGSDSPAAEVEGKKQRRSHQMKRKSRKPTTTTTPPPESSEEGDDDEDEDNSTNLHSDADTQEENDDVSKDKNSVESPTAKAIAGSSPSTKSMNKTESGGGSSSNDAEVEQEKSAQDDDNESDNQNIIKKSRRVYQTKRYSRRSETHRQSRRRQRNEEVNDEQL